MKFSVNARHWWTRSTATEQWSLDDRWLPLLGLGGVLTALLFSVWCCGPSALTAEEIVKDATVATAAAMPGDFHQLPAVHIRLRADAAGTLASIALNGQAVKDIDDLRGQIRAFLVRPLPMQPWKPSWIAMLICVTNRSSRSSLQYPHTPQLMAGAWFPWWIG